MLIYSWLYADCGIPYDGSITLSKRPNASVTGWILRYLPNVSFLLSMDLWKTIGVQIALPETISLLDLIFRILDGVPYCRPNVAAVSICSSLDI